MESAKVCLLRVLKIQYCMFQFDHNWSKISYLYCFEQTSTLPKMTFKEAFRGNNKWFDANDW